jgi:hypothetical protein
MPSSFRRPGPPDADAAGSEALAHWRRQETEPLPDYVLHGDYWEDRAVQSGDRLPSGWWILPVLIASMAAWVALALFVGG